MIVTVTPNPSLDRTVTVPSLVRGAVLRAGGVGVEPSGKGVNVALALAGQGHPVVAVLPAGGPTGSLVLTLLRGGAPGVRLEAVPVAGEVRTNTSLVEPDGTVTKVNEPGPALSADEVAALLRATAGAASGATWVATCGSLPPGAPGDLHGRVVDLARAAGASSAVDASGGALVAALASRPDLVKPNAEELAEATGRALATLGDVVEAARALRARGAGAVLASLGPDGALLVDAAGALHATAPVTRVLSAVGAGDALLAGYLAGARSPRERLAEAVRWAAAAVASPSTLFALGDAATTPVQLAAPEPDRPLTEPAHPPT